MRMLFLKFSSSLMWFRTSIATGLALLILAPASSALAWSNDPTVNTPVCTFSATQYEPQVVGDGAGGAIITWEDLRTGNISLYAQRVDSTGANLWTSNGLPICSTGQNVYYSQAISDGSGGAIVAWADNRNGINNWDIYAQRISPSGSPLWTVNGVAICTATDMQSAVALISDGSGGAIFTWMDQRTGGGQYDIYVQRVNSAGVVQWTTNGVAICTAASEQNNPQLVSDGAGGAIVTWADYRVGFAFDVYAQRVNSSGVSQWTANGAPVSTTVFSQGFPQLTGDGAGGAIITWTDERNGLGNNDIYAQRINSSGSPLWTLNGVAVCIAPDGQGGAQIVSDGAGGAIIAWPDGRSSISSDIYAQRFTSTGTALWAANGIAVTTTTGTQDSIDIVSDGAGGAIIAWQDGRNGQDIYAQRVSTSGTSLWTLNGLAIGTAANVQEDPQLISTATGTAIIAWRDFRAGLTDIYAQHTGLLSRISDWSFY